MPASISLSTSYAWPAQAMPSRILVARQDAGNGTTEPSAEASQEAAPSSAAPAQSSDAGQGKFLFPT